MKTVSVLAAAALALAVPSAASAQTKQKGATHDMWCRDQPVAEASTAQICMAFTYEQCMASRASPTESCYLNPRYDPRYRRN